MADVETESSCRDFVVRWFRALDDRDYETLAESFTEDGVWERGSERLVGPDAVRAAMATRAADLETQHLALNMVVDIESEDRAIVSYTIMTYAQLTDKPYHLHGMFRAADHLTRTAAGWRLVRRSATPAFPAQD